MSEKKIKIAILSFYGGSLDRGVENWVYELASRLSKKHKVKVYQNGKQEGKVEYEVESACLKVDWNQADSRGTLRRRIFVDYWSRLVAKHTLFVVSKLFRGKYDIIVPANGGWQPAFLRLLTWTTRKKMVIVGHSGKGWDERNNIYSFPNLFVGLSREAVSWARRINPLIKVAYIPNGIDLKRFNKRGSQVNLLIKRPIVLAVGAPEAGKRLELIIKAVAATDYSLLILGKGYQEEYVRKLGKRLLGDRFLMKGVPYKEMPKYYRSVDVFVNASEPQYSFEMVIVESLATNLPVVVNDDPVRREIVGKAGLFVNPVNTNDFAGAIKQVINTDWGNRPRKRAEKYSWDIVAKKYEDLFLRLTK